MLTACRGGRFARLAGNEDTAVTTERPSHVRNGPASVSGASAAAGAPASHEVNGHGVSFAGLIQSLSRIFGEIREYLAYLIAAELDAVKLAVRSAVIYAVLGVVALLGAAAVVVTAVVLLLEGAAEGISAALNGRLWAGELIVSVGVLAIIVVSALVALGAVKRSSRRLTVEKYETRKRDQRTRLGEDVSERAARSGR